MVGVENFQPPTLLTLDGSRVEDKFKQTLVLFELLIMNETPYDKLQKKELILRDHLAIDRTNLAIERTFLAYLRTALTLFAVGVTLIQFFKSLIFFIIGFIFIPASILVFIIGLFRLVKMKQAVKKVKESNSCY